MRKFFRKLAWLVCSSLVPGLVWGASRANTELPVRQEAGFHHTGWDSLGAVFDIKQSPEGYLWLTTSKGVLRFDGVRFQSVEEVTRGAVHDDEIDSVFLSSSGGLWLTTQGAGLLFWKDGRLTSFPDRRCTPIRKQGKIVEDRDGALWVQATAGLFRLRGTVCEQMGSEQGYPGGFPAGILLDSEGTLWVKTRTSPLLLLPHGGSKFQATKAGAGLSTGYAFLHEAPDGSIWLSDDQGLRRVAEKLSASAKLQPGEPHKGPSFGDFTFAPDGTLWAATAKGVQHFYHVEKWAKPIATLEAPGQLFTPDQGLTSDAVWKVLVDREGAWIGTNSGLDWLRRVAVTSVRLPPAQEHEYSVAAGDNGSVWTGNSSLPLTHVAADGTITSFPRTKQTLSVWRDHTGTIWSAGAGEFHLWRSSGNGFAPLHYPDENLDFVVFVAADRSNAPWITTSSGRAFLFSGGKWIDETQTLGKKPGVIGAMADDRDGNVWFAFSNKVVRWNGTSFDRFAFPEGQRGVNENTMSLWGDHVWLGGAGGVQLFTKGEFYLMRWKDRGLPGRVSGIVETQTGDLWVNGFSGLTHVPASEVHAWLNDPDLPVSGEQLNELDGLPGLSGEAIPAPSLVEGPDGRLWLATTKGIAWIDPVAFEQNRNRVPPPVIVSSVISNGKTYADSSSVRLPARSENLEIDYTALSLAIPERVLFRYRLDGVDDWQDVGTRREAYYTKLRPGRYQFHVIASNNDGVWNQTGATLDLSVAPAWFQTYWFVALCTACGMFLIWATYRLRMGQVAARINQRFDERLAERTRIAQELHDTLLQGFLSASMQVQVATDSLAEDSQAKRILSRTVQLMGQMIEEGRNAVQGLRLTNSASSNLEQAFATIQEEFQVGSEGKDVQFRVLAEGQGRPLHPLIRDEFYRIGREALTNAFRHANANHIDVELKYGPKQFRLLVRDDGCGIEPGILEKGRSGHWGLSGMRERAERIGARLHVFSRASAGTEIELSVPARVAFQDESGGIGQWLRKRGYASKLRSFIGLDRAQQSNLPPTDGEDRRTQRSRTIAESSTLSVTPEVQESEDE